MRLPASYRAYGLTLASAFGLPGLPLAPATHPADVRIRRGRLGAPPTSGQPQASGTARVAHLALPGVGILRVADGNLIDVDLLPGTAEAALQPYLLGAALGLLLHQRGVLALHASAVALDGGAVVFAGDSGAGKSTLAAMLAASGAPLLADDIVALHTTSGWPSVALPAVTQCKLWPEALAAIHASRPIPAPRASASLPLQLPLRRIYLLRYGVALGTRQLAPHTAFRALMAYAYAPPLLGPAAATPALFHQCVALAESGLVYEFERPHALDQLVEVARFIMALP